jgi:S1-C subfamily serine protease
VVFLRSEVPEAHPSAAVLGTERMGAAVAVGPRQVLTAHYLVLGASQAVVVGGDGRLREARRMALDHETGIALLNVDGPDLRPARMGRSATLRAGQPIFLLTCTGEQERKGASGLVISIGPFEAFWEYMLDDAIMTTIPNPGLAGAPLYDGEARLVGIISLGLAAVGRYSLAIPIDLFTDRRQEMTTGQRGKNRPLRAWIGFYPQAFDGGVAVTNVVPGGPADQAGLRKGDLLLSVDGQTVGSLRDLYRAIWRKSPGETSSFQVLRESAILVIEVTGGDRAAFYE